MRTSVLNCRLEVIDGVPQAVFEGVDQHEKILLTFFLHPDPHFVPDVLYEISLVERRAVDSSGFETDFIEVLIYRDHALIKPRVNKLDEVQLSEIQLSVDEAKLLLLEWGAKIQRWTIEQKNQGLLT